MMRVLLLHGYSGSPNNFLQLKEDLEREGYQVLAPLLPFHENAKELSKHSLTDFQAWFDQYLADTGEVSIIGYSFGAQLAMTSKHKNIMQRILIAPPFRPKLFFSLSWLGKIGKWIILPKNGKDPSRGLEKVPLRGLELLSQANKEKKKVRITAEIYTTHDFVTWPSPGAKILTSKTHNPFDDETYEECKEYICSLLSRKGKNN